MKVQRSVQGFAHDDLYAFLTRDLTATIFQISGDVPSPRVGHVSAFVSRGLEGLPVLARQSGRG